MITMQMGEMKMFETRALFIGLREALGRWHLCGIHIGATRETWRQVMQRSTFKVNLKEGVGDKGVRSVEGVRCVRSLKGSSHMCEHTLRN